MSTVVCHSYCRHLFQEDFSVYAKLRDLRKQIAQAEAVPVYTVFTNEQLAVMVQQCATSKSALAHIDGIGPTRIEKYGEAFLSLMRDRPLDTDEEARPEAGEVPSV